MGMRPMNDPYGGHAPLVDKLIGNAYDHVRFVAVNMPAIKHVSANLEAVYNVHSNMDAVKNVSQLLTTIAVLQAQIADLQVRVQALET